MSSVSSEPEENVPAPLEDPQLRRKRIARALVEILAEEAATSSQTSTSFSVPSECRDLLIEFIQHCHQEMAELQHRDAALEDNQPS